jgi:predicted RNase H-like nuclease (RuvC/YqgF family)
MARHPDVKEKEIIEAAMALEAKGKMPNPGAIRAQLGFRGGLVRIRDVWAKHQAKLGDSAALQDGNQLSLEDLPTELADATSTLINQQQAQLEQIVVASYQRCQSLFDKRLDEHIAKFDSDISFYREYELSADESITRLEADLRELQDELKALADQNATLLINNSQLSGQLLAFEKALPKVSKEAFIEKPK